MHSIRTRFILLSLLCCVALATDPPRYRAASVSPADTARAQAYLADHLALPADWQWQNIPFDDGFVRVGSSTNIDAKATLLFIPGFTGSIEFYAGFYEPWLERGYRVMALDLPGQGGSSRRADNPEKPWSGNFHDYARILSHTIRVLSEDVEGSLVLVGDSFGGHVALRAAHEYSLPVDGIVAMVPALELFTPGLPEGVAKGYARAMTWLGLGRLYAPGQSDWQMDWEIYPETFGCGQRPDRVYLNEALFSTYPEFRVGGVTNEWVAGLEASGRALTADAEIKIPTTIILAGRDTIIKGNRADALCSKRLSDCHLVTLPQAQHCMLLESDETIDRVLAAIDETVVRAYER